MTLFSELTNKPTNFCFFGESFDNSLAIAALINLTDLSINLNPGASIAVNGVCLTVVSLEKELVELIWSKKQFNKGSKRILKNILYKYIPKNLIERPKMGFSIPLEEWLKGPLKDWASDLLQKKELEENYIDSEKVIKKWNEHIKGVRNWQYQLWPILIYQSWKKSLIN